MIPNVTRGEDFHGLMRYLVGPGRANEHVDPHLVGGDVTVRAWGPPGVLSFSDGARLADALAAPTRVRGSGPKAGPVWHCSLSIRAEDGALGDERWQRVAASFMRKMGWAEDDTGVAAMPWLAIHHGTSKAGNDHIHLVVSMVRDDGSLVDTHNDFARAQQACRDLETELELTPVTGPAIGLGSRGLSPAEVNRAARQGREPARLTLARIVRAAATAADSEAEFVAGVRAAGVRIAPYYAPGGAQVTGYKVGLRGRDEPMFGGGTLARDLTLPRLRLRWSRAGHDDPVALTEWRRNEPAAPLRPKPCTIAQIDRTNTELRTVWTRLRQMSPDKVEFWGQVAADTAGIFAAWSRRIEGDQPGPLARAADAAGHLAQLRRRAIKATPQPRPVTTGAAQVTYQFGIGGQGPVAEAIFLRQMLNTFRALGAAARAMGQARIAENIATVARRDLATVAARLPELPPHLMSISGDCPTISQATTALQAAGTLPTTPPPAAAHTTPPQPDRGTGR